MDFNIQQACSSMLSSPLGYLLKINLLYSSFSPLVMAGSLDTPLLHRQDKLLNLQACLYERGDFFIGWQLHS